MLSVRLSAQALSVQLLPMNYNNHYLIQPYPETHKTITYYTACIPAQDIVVKVMKMSQTHLMLCIAVKHINLMPLFLI